MKASVVGLLVFFVIGIAAKYVIVVPRATRIQMPRRKKLGALLLLTALVSVILLGAWAAELLRFGGNDEFTSEAAVLLALFCTIALLLLLFECVGPENALVYTVATGAIALHAGVALFSRHRRWEDVAVAATLMTTGATSFGLSLSRAGKAFTA